MRPMLQYITIDIALYRYGIVSVMYWYCIISIILISYWYNCFGIHTRIDTVSILYQLYHISICFIRLCIT